MNKISKLTAGICIVSILILFSNYYIFVLTPNERLMGPIQRIFYFHVGAAFASYLAFGIVLISASLYLKRKQKVFDWLLVASGEVAFLFCTLVLVTGMIWGYTAWNTVFRFEPRLVTFLLLWLLSFSFVLLRSFSDSENTSSHSAILGIVGSITVPIMVYSIKLLPQAAQLHPQVVENQGLKDPSFIIAFVLSSITVPSLAALLIFIRFKIAQFSEQIKK